MLEKLIGKKVIITEKSFRYGSEEMDDNKITGKVTAVDDKFIELDESIIISLNFIYEIKILDKKEK